MLRRSVRDANLHRCCRGSPRPRHLASHPNSPTGRSISSIAGAASTGWSKRCFFPVRSFGGCLTAEFTVRREARYDIAGSGWTPTSVSAAVVHARAGRRTPAETARVRRTASSTYRAAARWRARPTQRECLQHMGVALHPDGHRTRTSRHERTLIAPSLVQSHRLAGPVHRGAGAGR